MTQKPSTRVLRLPAVIDMTGIGRSSIYNYVNAGRFPKPIKLGSRAVGWREADVAAWLDARGEGEAA